MRYNIAPTTDVIGILASAEGKRQWRPLRWGLVPPWADSLAIGNRMINARSETVAEKRSFRQPFASQRCIIPASGYYEWQTDRDQKQPFHIHPRDDVPFAMAGLWEQNSLAAADGQTVWSCTLLTVAANDVTAPIHDRMPVVLDADSIPAWLDRSTSTSRLQSLCQPAANDFFVTTPVGRQVNRPTFDHPSCLEPVKILPPTQPDLF
ncbi:Putative SOS response-associated peptidase YedK [Roseimaritima multifibrata]|uniref:Abasic site processing protein n=2 Tax=Roseimaritima multifibrata TaxID=1930274 RepID=A0A517MBY9_9BACT|nr:Putative SOS response-associated peptidase YedK [Roseimaritima multifibrata]